MAGNCIILTQGDSPLYAPGVFMEGGFYYGVIVINGVRYGLIAAPKEYMISGKMIKTNTTADGIDGQSLNDGWANTNNMNNSLHPIYQTVRSMTINGYNDWYIPSIDELEVFYRNMKPQDVNNVLTNGATISGRAQGYNPNSDPVGEAYTNTYPAQTRYPEFRYQTGSQQGGAAILISSTEHVGDPTKNLNQWQVTYPGLTSTYLKNYLPPAGSNHYARPIRKFRL